MESIYQNGDIIAKRYRVLHILGQGGSATTYAVEDIQIGRQIALKALSLRHTTNWKQLELFEREAQILKKLNHPNIPCYLNYFQIDTAESRTFYLAQALAEGTSLAMLVETGWRCNEQGVRQIAKQVLQVLEYLHSLTPPVIHRDIKPQNLILSKSGQISLVDFGAVQASDRDPMTKGSTVVGTYGYMAPEQFRGDAVPGSDLYGLGTTLLFLLTHRVPSDLPQKRLRIHFRDRVQISETFANWLEKLIEPDVEDRFTSARAALNALQRRVLVSKPIRPLNWAVVVGSGIASVAAIALLVVFRYPVLRVFGFTPPNICYASLEEIKTYLDQWGDPNLVLKCMPIGTRIDFTQSQIEELIKLLIEKGSDINAQNEDGYTTVMTATQRGLTDIIKLLVENGADVNAKTKNGQTALMMASERRQINIVKLLVKNKANVHAKDRDGYTPLIMAIQPRQMDIIVRQGIIIDVNAKAKTDIIKFLIEQGADVNSKISNGYSPLTMAIQSKQVSKLLLEHGADVNAKDNRGNTALMAAGQTDTIQLLIEHEADVNAQDEDGVTALMKACDRRLQTEIIKLLIEKGADVNAKCNNGCTALMFSSKLGPMDTIKLLIEKGADVNAKTKEGQTALSIANRSLSINGYVISEIVSLLKQHGAKE